MNTDLPNVTIPNVTIPNVTIPMPIFRSSIDDEEFWNAVAKAKKQIPKRDFEPIFEFKKIDYDESEKIIVYSKLVADQLQQFLQKIEFNIRNRYVVFEVPHYDIYFDGDKVGSA